MKALPITLTLFGLIACSSSNESEIDNSPVNQGEDEIPGNFDSDDGEDVVCVMDQNDQLMLQAVNEARAISRDCGDDFYPQAEPLSWRCELKLAAVNHSEDMALNDFFSHTGSDDSDVSLRIESQDYLWRAVGENIAAGQSSVEEVMTGWLDSPGHCRNIMNAIYTEFGSSKIDSSTSRYSSYWTQVFATPR